MNKQISHLMAIIGIAVLMGGWMPPVADHESLLDEFFREKEDTLQEDHEERTEMADEEEAPSIAEESNRSRESGEEFSIPFPEEELEKTHYLAVEPLEGLASSISYEHGSVDRDGDILVLTTDDDVEFPLPKEFQRFPVNIELHEDDYYLYYKEGTLPLVFDRSIVAWHRVTHGYRRFHYWGPFVTFEHYLDEELLSKNPSVMRAVGRMFVVLTNAHYSRVYSSGTTVKVNGMTAITNRHVIEQSLDAASSFSDLIHRSGSEVYCAGFPTVDVKNRQVMISGENSYCLNGEEFTRSAEIDLASYTLPLPQIPVMPISHDYQSGDTVYAIGYSESMVIFNSGEIIDRSYFLGNADSSIGDHWIASTAHVYYGCSGGPLIKLIDGNPVLIGINTQVYPTGQNAIEELFGVAPRFETAKSISVLDF